MAVICNGKSGGGNYTWKERSVLGGKRSVLGERDLGVLGRADFMERGVI